ncbi:TetR/AcrR family transcriptional regulator [Blastococcus goldschmidtiae]|uniref:TetR/AcrR family transcriptional regulator n=1 Tax=Blastococcus goldschmidtiae TaxID=3075546 RepID=A0ABU2K557_9ACTN|nr:TetR/AcrR family transcriptional regulator [Blastococcus sp. DSM 46792]MDT0275309.1 TetR/AcrR family transcriptional regulator [Blastococcus sp. DSM 46792]
MRTSEQPQGSAWQWSRTADTRRTLITAAGEVFAQKGFAECSVADVVELAGLSVGSLYHHYGGKSELFLAVWEDHQAAYEEQAATAVALARRGGTTAPAELFLVGARAYLETTWERRALARLFLDGDGPPGFFLVRSRRRNDWVRQNAVLLAVGTGPADRLLVSILTAAMGEAGRQIIGCETEEQAVAVTESALAIIRRLSDLRGE